MTEQTNSMKMKSVESTFKQLFDYSIQISNEPGEEETKSEILRVACEWVS